MHRNQMSRRSGGVTRRSLIAAAGAGIAASALCFEAVAAPLELNVSGDLAIDGRRVWCKPRIKTILDARLPNLGIATRSQLVLNPRLLARLSPTVRMFVYHHECGHHHVGGDEFGADCWAVNAGVAAGWLQERQLGEICTSFGNSRATATHPATAQRCQALQKCFAKASRAASQVAAGSESNVRQAPATSAPAPSPQLVHEGFAAPIAKER